MKKFSIIILIFFLMFLNFMKYFINFKILVDNVDILYLKYNICFPQEGIHHLVNNLTISY